MELRQLFRQLFRHLFNITHLGIKELRSLAADPVMVVVIVWAFSIGIYIAATATSSELHHASIAIVDLDHSPATEHIAQAFYPPYFQTPRQISLKEMDGLMDRGVCTFALIFPANFQRDLLAGRRPEIALAIDATQMSQAFLGASYIQNILAQTVASEMSGTGSTSSIKLVSRVRFNPNLTGFWFGGVVEVINNVTLLSIILVGAAFIREREHGTIEHLMVMPLSPVEILLGKVLANGLVVLLAVTFALTVMLERVMAVPIAGSVPLFLAGAALYLFSTASMGIFLATLARSMPQFGLLIILTILPLEMLSGGVTPRESMPQLIQDIMLAAPTTHFVKLAQAILYRGADLSIVWPEMLAITLIGGLFFSFALARFRKAMAQNQ